jgi:ABC-type phosphate/phosphonate transport system ATPase subunit
MYKLTGVTKTYSRRGGTVIAVRDVDLTIADGEWLAIQGRTGSGKTTLLQLLGAMHQPDRGVVSLGGHDLTRLPEPRLAQVRDHGIVQPVDRIGPQAQQARPIGVYSGGSARLLQRFLEAVHPRVNRMASPDMPLR